MGSLDRGPNCLEIILELSSMSLERAFISDYKQPLYLHLYRPNCNAYVEPDEMFELKVPTGKFKTFETLANRVISWEARRPVSVGKILSPLGFHQGFQWLSASTSY